MSADTVSEVNAVVEEVIEQVAEPVEQVEEQAQDTSKEERVPLSALQKERRKRQDVEQELRWHKEQMQQKVVPTPEPDESAYEAATKQDLGRVKQQLKREVAEEAWIKDNPEKVADINERLTEFLKQRPHLGTAIDNVINRYEEAWELMDKLSPKQKAALRVAPAKKESPGNPASTPKAAAINQTVDVMQMSDSEFNTWRKSQRKPR